MTVDITYEWHIRAEKPFLKLFSPILKPIFAANHRWANVTGRREPDHRARATAWRTARRTAESDVSVTAAHDVRRKPPSNEKLVATHSDLTRKGNVLSRRLRGSA